METGNYISRQEHEEFCRRMEDEHHRQNRRIELLEESVRQTGAIATSVEKLATNMEGMVREQERQGERLDKQGERLDALEKEPGDTWQHIKAKAIDTAVGVIAGAAVTGAVIMAAQYIHYR